MRVFVVFLMWVAVGSASIASESSSPVRCLSRTLTDRWHFSKDGGKSWQSVRVPHDWAIEGPFDAFAGDGHTGKLPWRGRGQYRLDFKLNDDEQRMLENGGVAYLTFDGVMASPRVLVNGRDAGGWDYGYLGFSLNVTEILKMDGNLVEVACDTTHHNSRWYPGAGIYRKVTFAVKPALHVKPGSLAITTPVVTRERATVRVAYETCLGATNYTFEVARPHLWDVDDPHLSEIEILGERFRYGIREAHFTPDDGFHLNGRRVQLKGVNLHSDLGVLGVAVNKSALRRQLRVMRDMGANAVRTSHNPPAPELLDLCDEMGLLVWDECFDKWDATSGRRPDQGLEAYVVRNLRQFVRRDRNHPSVIAWSIGNEIWEWDPSHPIRNDDPWLDRGPSGQTRVRNSLFASVVRQEDGTRPVACGNRPYMNEKRILDMDLWTDIDVVGWNYLRSYTNLHARLPSKPVVYTESASAVSTFGHYENRPPRNRDEGMAVEPYVDSMDMTMGIDLPDVEFARMKMDRYVAGEFVWTGIDYLGEPIPFDKKARSSYFGCVDLTGVPKDRFYLYRAHWNPDKVTVHIVPHWNWQSCASERRTVFVYTNGDEAELFLNGKSLGRRYKGDPSPFSNEYYGVMANYRLMWTDVNYVPGELKAVAYCKGVRIGDKVVRTAGEPAALRLEVEPRFGRDADELAWVRVSAVDANGLPHPLATSEVDFRLEGPGEIVAIGNGDPAGLKPFKDTRAQPLFYGRCMVVLRRTGKGKVVLHASAPSLGAHSVEIVPSVMENP